MVMIKPVENVLNGNNLRPSFW